MVAVLRQPAVDGRDQVHDVRVAFERHVLRHAHGSELANASEIVASEIDEHHVFGALLLVAFQFFGEPQILVVVGAARSRAGDRDAFRRAAFDADQHLRRRADDRQRAHAHEIHVRRRVHVAERAVDGERIGGDVGFEALRQDGLVDVAGSDVLLDRADSSLEDVAGLVRPDLRRLRGPRAPAVRALVRARARGTGSWRRQTDTAPRGPRRAVMRALAMMRIRCLT